MAEIVFSAKVRERRNADGTLAYRFVNVPVFNSGHYRIDDFRRHPTYGPIANSDLFRGALAKLRASLLSYRDSPIMRLDRMPANVAIDESGFLATVTVVA